MLLFFPDVSFLLFEKMRALIIICSQNLRLPTHVQAQEFFLAETNAFVDFPLCMYKYLASHFERIQSAGGMKIPF